MIAGHPVQVQSRNQNCQLARRAALLLEEMTAPHTAMAQSLVREIDGHVRGDVGAREGFRSASIPAASAMISKERSRVAWS